MCPQQYWPCWLALPQHHRLRPHHHLLHLGHSLRVIQELMPCLPSSELPAHIRTSSQCCRSKSMHALTETHDTTSCSVVNHRTHAGWLYCCWGLRLQTAYLILAKAAFDCRTPPAMASVWAITPCIACMNNMRTAVCSTPYDTEHQHFQHRVSARSAQSVSMFNTERQHFQHRAALLDNCPCKTISRGTEDPC